MYIHAITKERSTSFLYRSSKVTIKARVNGNFDDPVPPLKDDNLRIQGPCYLCQ